jgi:pimeloyl-ACP methyl ester carboxylesterase
MRTRAPIAGVGLALVALAFSACGGDVRAGSPASSPVATATRAAAPAVARVRGVRFRASDGKPVTGVYRPADAGAPAVVLVHGLVGGADQWKAFAHYLHAAGFATLAYEGRGGVQETELVKEVGGAVAFLRRRHDVDARRLGIVGSSVGASTAVLAMTAPEGRRLRAAVALSPPAAPVLDTLMHQHRYHPHDVLFVSDYRERPTVKPLTQGAVGSRTAVSEMIGHGVALLDDEANRRVVLEWLERQLG